MNGGFKPQSFIHRGAEEPGNKGRQVPNRLSPPDAGDGKGIRRVIRVTDEFRVPHHLAVTHEKRFPVPLFPAFRLELPGFEFLEKEDLRSHFIRLFQSRLGVPAEVRTAGRVPNEPEIPRNHVENQRAEDEGDP